MIFCNKIPMGIRHLRRGKLSKYDEQSRIINYIIFKFIHKYKIIHLIINIYFFFFIFFNIIFTIKYV